VDNDTGQKATQQGPQLGEGESGAVESSSSAMKHTRVKGNVLRDMPAPRWCPPGLIKTQCRRVQKLRAHEIKE
jgi:hypothetical protein